MRYTEGQIEKCLQDEPPFCRVSCPFHFDVIDFVAKIGRGGWKPAYRAFQNAVGFPAIVAALCPQACQRDCPRNSLGGPIALRELEAAVIARGAVAPNAYNMPPKGRRIAVIGAGPSGLAATLRLAQKGYTVTLYEKSGRIGGHLYELLPKERFLPEIEHQFQHENYELVPDRNITSLDGIEADAVYIASGRGGSSFDLRDDPGGAFATNRPGVFWGGSLRGRDTMEAIADGLWAVNSIERFLKTGAMTQPHQSWSSRLQMEPGRVSPQPVTAAVEGIYSPDEAVREAERCLRCACDACYRACDLMNYFQKFPKRMAEEIEVTVTPGTLDGNGTVATRLIASCNQCGLCKAVCPVDIDMGELFLHSHRAMREKGAMPWAFHDFYLRDMDWANTEAGLCRLPPGHERCRQLFFPGCQLGASDPRYVSQTYRFLLEKWPDTGILLACCSAPAEWAGDQPKRNLALEAIRVAWEGFGRPRLILACPSCNLILQHHLPQIDTVFVYRLLTDHRPSRPPCPDPLSVFDPCAAREEPELQSVIRRLVRAAGHELAPLPMEGRQAQCCSWGGQVAVAHPPYARHMARQRALAGQLPYVTYCSNCRDILAAAGKPVRHILDLVLNLNADDRAAPRLGQRRLNRLILKRDLLNAYWQEESTMPEQAVRLIIPERLAQKLSDELILEEEVAQVVDHCERSGQKVWDPDRSTFSGHLPIGQLTVWVEYRIGMDGRPELCNAYAHRMRIDGEECCP